jgi:Immunity protein 8
MKPTLKGLSSIDLPDGTSLPEDPGDCWVVVTASIGLAEDEGSDDFTLYVCTPRRLDRVVADESQLWGQHLLIVERFDWSVVRTAVEKMCDEITDETWDAIASRLSRYAAWEFEDYREAVS